MKTACSYCRKKYHPWMECPKVQRREVPSSYGWKFAQGQNPSRREDFFKKAAEDPFGVTSE